MNKTAFVLACVCKNEIKALDNWTSLARYSYSKIKHLTCSSVFVLLLFFTIQFTCNKLYAQDYKDISLRGFQSGTLDACPPTNGFDGAMVIHPSSGFAGIGIGWGANLYLASEAGSANTIYDLTWFVAKDITYSGNTYTFDNVDIWMYETTGTQFPNTSRPDVENWAIGTNVPVGVSNVVKVISNKTLTVKIPTSAECIASSVTFDTPYNYTGTKSLVIYLQKKTKNTYPSGFLTIKHNQRESSSIRRICNWGGTVANPLPATSNAANTNKFARVVFNRAFTGTQVNSSCSTTSYLTSCLPETACTNTLTYPSSNCQTGTISPTVSPSASGSYSCTAAAAPAGSSATVTPADLAINATTGVIDLAASKAGTYTVQLTISSTCKPKATVVIKTTPDAAGTITSAATDFCTGGTYTFSVPAITNATSYTWSYTGANATINGTTNPVTIDFASNATSGVLTVKGKNGTCEGTSSATYSITIKPTPTLNSLTSPVALCSGSQTNIAASTDVAGATISWTTANTNNITGASSGSGTAATSAAIIAQTLSTANTTASGSVDYVIKSVLNGCEDTKTVKVNVALAPKMSSVATKAICDGETVNHQLTSDVEAGVTFEWIGAPNANVSTISTTKQTTTLINNTLALNSGVTSAQLVTYSITPKIGTCTGAQQTLSVTVSPKPTIDVTALSKTICSGEALGIDLSTGMPNGATYSWNALDNASVTGETQTAQTTSTITDELINTSNANQLVNYKVTLKIGSCTNTNAPATVTVTVRPKISITSSTVTSPTLCVGETVQLTSNGTAPASGSPWSSSNTSVATISATGLVSALKSGVTTISFTDINSCTSTKTTPFTVTVLDAPVIAGSSSACVGSKETLTVTGGNGVLANTNPWSSSNVGFASIDANGELTALAVGTTEITYTDQKGCKHKKTITISDSVKITGSLSACLGASSQLSGTGTPASTSPWISSATAVATVSATGLVSTVTTGTTTITFKNSANCSGKATFTVKPKPTITNTITKSTECGSTTAKLELKSDADPKTTYSWTATSSGGTFTNLVTSGSGNINQLLSNTGTTSGTVVYVITPVLDGCEGVKVTYSVEVNPGPTIDNTSGVTSSSITACGTAKALFTPVSNVAGATFTWTAKNITPGSNITGFTSSGSTKIDETLTNNGTTVGTIEYSINVTANKCTTAAAYTYSVILHPKLSVTNTTGTSLTACETATAAFTPTSDVNGATFDWTSSVSPSGSIPNLITSGTGTINQNLINSGNATAVVNYTITPKATNVCPNSTGEPFTYKVTLYKNPEISVTATATTNNTICAGSTTGTQLTASGATTYTWSPTESLSSANGTTVTATPTVTTDYTVIGTDANGCKGTNSTAFKLTVSPKPDTSKIDLIITPSACVGNTGAVTIQNNSGEVYEYNFNNTSYTSQTAYSGLEPKAYTLQIKNTGGCIENLIVNIGTTGGPTDLTGTIAKEYCGRKDGEIAITGVKDGQSPYTFSTDGSVFGSSIPSSGGVLNTTQLYKNLAAGNYSIYVKDDNGCKFSKTFTVVEVKGPSGFVTTKTDELCGKKNGTIVIGSINGGTLPYTYSIDGGITYPGPASTTFSGLEAKTYVVFVKDANNCTFKNDVELTNKLGPTDFVITNENPTCSQSNGSIKVGNVTGGVAPYTYRYTSNLPFSPISTPFNNLPAGSYLVEVQDVNGCTHQKPINLTNIELTVELTSDISTLNSCDSVIVKVNLGANYSNATFSWNAYNTNGNVKGTRAFPFTGTSSQIIDTLKNIDIVQGIVQYDITPSLFGCKGVTKSYIVNVNPTPKIQNSITTNSVTACGQALASFTPASDIAGTTFKWTVVNTGASLSGYTVIGNGNQINETIKNNSSTIGTLIYTIDPVFNGCTGKSFNYFVEVRPIPKLTNLPPTLEGCDTVNVKFTPLAYVPGTVFNWTATNIGGEIKGYSFVPKQGSGNINEQLINISRESGSILFEITPTANNCAGAKESYQVTVHPTPKIINTLDSNPKCGAIKLNVQITADVPGATHNWTAMNSGALISGYVPSGSGTAIKDSLVNKEYTDGTIIYTLIPRVGNCIGKSFTYPIVISPVPQIVNTLTPLKECDTVHVFADLKSKVAGTNFSWKTLNTGASLQGFSQNGLGKIDELVYNTTSSAGYLKYIITPFTSSCQGKIDTLEVEVYSTPIIDGPLSVCYDKTVSLTASGNTLGTWFSSNTNVATINQLGEIKGISGGSAFISYKNKDGCASITTFTVVPIPVVNAVNQTFCNGTSVGPLEIKTEPVGATVKWLNNNPETGLPIGGTNTINVFTALNTGLAPISSTITATPTLNTCKGNPLEFTITVAPSPTITISAVDSSICINDSIQLKSSGGTQYTWTGPNNFASNLQNPVINNLTMQMMGTYTVNVGANTGTSLICTSKKTLPIQINPLPVISVTPDTSLCIGNSIVLTANSTDVTSYSWNGPNGFLSSNQSPVLKDVKLPDSGPYTVIVQNINQCRNAKIVNVKVNPIPSVPTFSPINAYCQNSFASPLAAVPNPGGVLNWYGTDTTLQHQAAPPIPFTDLVGTFSYYVSQTILGCESPKVAIDVTVNPLPVALINELPAFCVGDSALISFLQPQNQILTEVQWKIGTRSSISHLNDSLSVQFTEAGEFPFSIIIKDDKSCINTFESVNPIVVNENPTALFDYNPKNITLLEPTVTFTSQSPSSNNITFASWSFESNSDFKTIGNRVEHTFQNAGIYDIYFAVKSAKGCVDTIKKTIEVLEDFNVYLPNSFSPNGDGLNDEFYPQGTAISDEKYSLQIYNKWGELIFSTTDPTVHWLGQKGTSATLVPEDVYVYKFACQSTKGVKISKVGHVSINK